MSIAMPDTSASLTEEERHHFIDQGFLGPLTVWSPEEMLAMLPEIEHVLKTDPPDHKVRIHNRHLDSRLIHELATHPGIVERMAALYGNDLLLWRTNFFIKEEGAKEIPWHQDFNYWPLEPPIIISAWIAVDASTMENGCVQILPGSHRKVVPHVRAGREMQFREMADPACYDASKAVNLEMEPGQVILFNERTLHHSEPNHSAQRRIGLAIRVILPNVNVLHWDSPEHALVVIHGKDPLGFNRTVVPPSA